MIAWKRNVYLWASRVAFAIAVVHLALGITGKIEPLTTILAVPGWIVASLLLVPKT